MRETIVFYEKQRKCGDENWMHSLKRRPARKDRPPKVVKSRKLLDNFDNRKKEGNHNKAHNNREEDNHDRLNN